MKSIYCVCSLLMLMIWHPANILAQDSQYLPTQEEIASGIEVLDTFIQKLEATPPNEDGSYVLKIDEDDVGHNIILGAYFYLSFRGADSNSFSRGHWTYNFLGDKAYDAKYLSYRTLLNRFATNHNIEGEVVLRWHVSSNRGVIDVTLNFDQSYVDVIDQTDKSVQRRSFSGIMNGDLYQGNVGGLHRPDSPATRELQALITKFHSDPQFYRLLHTTPMQRRVHRVKNFFRVRTRDLMKTFRGLLGTAVVTGALLTTAKVLYPEETQEITNTIIYEYGFPGDFFDLLMEMVKGIRDEWSSSSIDTSDSFAFEGEER